MMSIRDEEAPRAVHGKETVTRSPSGSPRGDVSKTLCCEMWVSMGS